MSIFTKILGSGAVEKVTESVGKVVDNLTTSDEEKLVLKNQLTQTVLTALTSVSEFQADVIKTEMKGNWLQRSWRPLMMLTFGVILVAKWFGLTDTGIDHELELELMSIVKIGIGGYVMGRSAEKIASSVTKNIDMPFLKKKDR